ncbi:MAG: hypothetical protein ABSE56_05350 [Bryobacteraceae bacterium]|jgi:hypothetical protein
MSSFPGSPRLIKGGLVLLDPVTSAVQRVITLQYNPDQLSRSLQIQGQTGEGDRLEALRLKGPPIETIKLEAEIDATDQLEFPDQNPDAVQLGIAPQLAAIETIIYPDSSQLQNADQFASSGAFEIFPLPAPLTLFVAGKNRIVPVRVTEFSVTEEAFDPSLNPLRAKVSLGMRVLSVNDLDFASKGNSLYMIYQQTKERMARSASGNNLSTLGVGGML